MAELRNCPKCDQVFVKNSLRDVCESCYKEEEKLFEVVYQYIRKRENRTASLMQVVEVTGVEEDLIAKWIKIGKLKIAAFPNMGYKCEKCGTQIREGKLCYGCKKGLQSELVKFESDERLKKQLAERKTFYSK